MSQATRMETLDALAHRSYDILVVGGGITGAGIARQAAMEGLRVALVEKSDFAGGTSGRSSRLIHGGFRYLQQGQVGMVRRCLAERKRLAQDAPHLARPTPFLLPLYADAPYPSWALTAGMLLYRSLCGFRAETDCRRLNLRETTALEPSLDAKGLQGGLLYGEYLTHDARLTLETVLSAQGFGASALNYCEAEAFMRHRGRVFGAIVHDAVSGKTLEIPARVVVTACGAWTPPIPSGRGCRPLRLSKGVHVVFSRRRLPLNGAVVFFSPEDHRGLFAIPQENFVFVGTTETEYVGDPNNVAPAAADLCYLLEAAQARFPTRELRLDDIADAWAGLRPLTDNADRPTGQLSREYRVSQEEDGLISVAGGKLTLHRKMAEDALRIVRPQLIGYPTRRIEKNAPLPGNVWNDPPERVLGVLKRLGVSEASAKHLERTYGSRCVLFAELLRDDPTLAKPILPCLPHVWAEIPFAVEQEMAVLPEDYLRRRTDFALQAAVEDATPPPEVFSAFGNQPITFRIQPSDVRFCR